MSFQIGSTDLSKIGGYQSSVNTGSAAIGTGSDNFNYSEATGGTGDVATFGNGKGAEVEYKSSNNDGGLLDKAKSVLKKGYNRVMHGDQGQNAQGMPGFGYNKEIH